jgi:hypothetical protein
LPYLYLKRVRKRFDFGSIAYSQSEQLAAFAASQRDDISHA